MIKKIQLVICFVFGIICLANAQYTQISDANFEAALSNLDDILEDGQIPTNSITSIVTLNIANKNIKSLEGIEDFTSLKKLTANGNLLTSIDISALIDLEELILYENQITSIDLSNNLSLKEIDFYNNQLTNLDISQNTALVNVYIDSNLITSLDATQNTFLKRLDVSNNNLSSLNIKNGNNIGIDGFGATGNSNLTCIIVDDITYAQTNFTDVDNDVRYITKSCDYIPIPDANFEAALAIYDDIASDGHVPLVNIQNITSLNLDNLNINSLSGIEYFTGLTSLNANGNSLTTIDVSKLINLIELELSENQLTSIDLTTNIKLQRINFYNNLLSSINLSENTLLRRVFVDNNSISEIDLSLNILLEKVDVSNNNLTFFNLKNGNNTSINSFGAKGNSNLTCILVNDIDYAQTNFTEVDAGVVFNSINCDYAAIPDINFEAALEALGYDDVSGDGQVPTERISNIISLSVTNKNIIDVTGIESFIALEELNISSNNLTSVDLSENTLLTNINFSNTSIKTIDLSKNTALTVLTADQTELLSIDLSQNSKLNEVSLTNGKIIFVNLQNNENSNINNISLSNNPNLKCVAVDDVNYATTNWTDIDTANIFSANTCTPEYTLIPDLAFEARLFNLGYDDISEDGQVPTEFIKTITSLDLSSSSITDITGIVDFTSLEVLTVSSTSLTTLNLSGNTVIKEIYAEPSSLETVDVSGMTALEVLHCNQANVLTSINLTGATSLKELSLHSTIGITNIDISTNTALEKLNAYQSTVTTLNTTGAISLKELVVYNNGSLENLDLSTNTALEIVNANSSGLSSINTTGAIALKELYVYQTNVSELDVRTNSALTTLHCYNNSNLTSLNTFDAVAITDIQCQNTSIASLNFSTNVNLETLYCSNTSVVSLDLRNGNNSSLINFDASSNNDLDCIMVDDVNYAETNFTNIDNGTGFSISTCGYTLIPDSNFETALSTYDDIANDGKVPTVNIEAITRLFINSKSISDLTGIEDFIALELLYCAANALSSLDLSKNINLIELNAVVNNITELDLSQNTNLETVIINRNNLTEIDVTQNTQLKTLSVWGNDISEINITQNLQLESLVAFGLSNLTTIDVSKNTALTELDVSDCAVSEVDLTNNPNLREIYIYNNNITSIDLSKNPLLKYVYISNNAIDGYLDMSMYESLIDFEAINCGLTALNLKNGNNAAIDYLDISDNSNLNCVQVDDATYSTTNWTKVDSHTSFNEDCGYNFLVVPKVILEGAFELSGNTIMHDNLRSNNHLPTTSPYTDALTCNSTILHTTGETAVVDWVEVQLRSASDITQIITSKSALLLRNGNVVDTDGISPVLFSQVQGDFYLSIAHRNHLTIVTKTFYSFSSSSTSIDLTNSENVNMGSTVLKTIENNYKAIPLGDIDENGQIQNIDVSKTVLQIGNSGYSIFDVDMNGQIQNIDIYKMQLNIGKGEQF